MIVMPSFVVVRIHVVRGVARDDINKKKKNRLINSKNGIENNIFSKQHNIIIYYIDFYSLLELSKNKAEDDVKITLLYSYSTFSSINNHHHQINKTK